MDTAGNQTALANSQMAPGMEQYGVPQSDTTDDQASMQAEYGAYDALGAMPIQRDIGDNSDRKLMMAAWMMTHKAETSNALCRAEVVAPQKLDMSINPVPWFNRFTNAYQIGPGTTGYPGQRTNLDNRQANMAV